MQGLVHVGLGERDVVLEAPGEGGEHPVHHAQHRVAVGHRLDDHAERDDVVDLLEVALAGAHLSPDGIDVLDAPLHVGVEARLGEARLDHRRGAADVLLALGHEGLHPRGELLEAVGLEVAEREVFELRLHPRDAQAVRQGGVDLAGLPGDALLRLGLHVVERAHVVEAVRELHEQHADVLRHVQEHLAKALGLTVLLRGEVELRELGDPVDEEHHLLAELVLHLVERRGGVFDGVVQQRGDDRRRVEPQLGDHLRHRDGVRKIRLAALAQLPRVVALAELKRPPDQRHVGFGVVARDALDEVFERLHAVPPVYAFRAPSATAA